LSVVRERENEPIVHEEENDVLSRQILLGSLESCNSATTYSISRNTEPHKRVASEKDCLATECYIYR
jgi:hypothetical protein